MTPGGIRRALHAAHAGTSVALVATGALIHWPELRLAVPATELHWGHGDGLVLRGLSELPVVPGPQAAQEP